MSTPLRIVFLGSDPIARPLLNWLAGQGKTAAEVVGVFTQPDRATGRGQKVQPNEIKTWAQERNLPVFQPDKITEDVRVQLAGLGADVALVMAYGHILRDDFIGTPRLGTLNFHTSLLPKYRGASPIQTAIANGEKETGVTLMRIVRRLDAGPIADVERVAIGSLDTASDIEAKLSEACVPLLARALPKLREGSLEFIAQDDAAATYCRRLEKADGSLDFAQSSTVLASRINGLFPWPACSIAIDGVEVKIGLADSAPGTGSQGEVIGMGADGLCVGTSDGVLRLKKLQRPGGKMLSTQEFLRGFSVAPGTRLTSRPMAPLVANAPFRR